MEQCNFCSWPKIDVLSDIVNFVVDYLLFPFRTKSWIDHWPLSFRPSVHIYLIHVLTDQGQTSLISYSHPRHRHIHLLHDLIEDGPMAAILMPKMHQNRHIVTIPEWDLSCMERLLDVKLHTSCYTCVLVFLSPSNQTSYNEHHGHIPECMLLYMLYALASKRTGTKSCHD